MVLVQIFLESFPGYGIQGCDVWAAQWFVGSAWYFIIDIVISSAHNRVLGHPFGPAPDGFPIGIPSGGIRI